MKGLTAVLTFGLIAGVATSAAAQQGKPPKESAQTIPADSRPPKGMCRVWLNGVPAAQQPAPTDCATAVKNLPANARVIFGDDYKDTAKTNAKPKLPPVKGFTDVNPPPIVPRRPPDK